jgi:transposase
VVVKSKLVSDALWAKLKALLPPEPPKPKGGRPRVDDRAALTGIVFVLRTGIQWRELPSEMGCGSGVTCWRRLRDWQRNGVWDRLHKLLLEQLQGAKKLDWSGAVLDSSSVAAKRGANSPGETRPIAVGPAASTTSSPTDKGTRSVRRRSRRPTSTTARRSA